jgi:hypothetical protein
MNSKSVLILASSLIFVCVNVQENGLHAQSNAPSKPAISATPFPATPAQSGSYVTDGGAGPCSAEFTVTGPDGKPVFAALINVHIAYGFGGFHKLDMGVYTNEQGKGKFTGIPAKVKHPPLEFQASKDQLTGVGTVDPAAECQAQHDIILRQAPPAK